MLDADPTSPDQPTRERMVEDMTVCPECGEPPLQRRYEHQLAYRCGTVGDLDPGSNAYGGPRYKLIRTATCELIASLR